jgi:hypothetical protein
VSLANMPCPLRRAFPALVLILGLSAAARPLAAGQPCAIAIKGDSPVAQACAEGGLVSAKRSMRDLTKRAKAGGLRFECDDCHRNDVDYDLTPQARDNFRHLLAAAGVRS